jgi:hypothetical protein
VISPESIGETGRKITVRRPQKSCQIHFRQAVAKWWVELKSGGVGSQRSTRGYDPLFGFSDDHIDPLRTEGKDRSLHSVSRVADINGQILIHKSTARGQPGLGTTPPEMARPETIVSGLRSYLAAGSKATGCRKSCLKLDQLASYHRHRVRLSWITFSLRLKNEPDRKLARRSRTKAKHLHNLFTVRNTVPWFFEATPKKLYALNEWRYSPEIPGSGIRFKAHRKFPADGYHDGFEFHTIAFLSGGVGHRPSRDPPSSSITPR